MKKYRIVYSTDPGFTNIEMPFDFEGKQSGDKVIVLGQELTLSQVGTVVQGHNETQVFTLQEIPDEQ